MALSARLFSFDPIFDDIVDICDEGTDWEEDEDITLSTSLIVMPDHCEVVDVPDVQLLP